LIVAVVVAVSTLPATPAALTVMVTVEAAVAPKIPLPSAVSV
jgi:hypothetical protein